MCVPFFTFFFEICNYLLYFFIRTGAYEGGSHFKFMFFLHSQAHIGIVLINSSNDMSKDKTVRGSTFGGAFSCMPVSLVGFGEAHSQSIPFGSFRLLFSLKS